jgi:hypothetical protein
MTQVSIADDFSATPGGRFNRDGPFSGQAFRERFLEPSIDRNEVVDVYLDRVAGLPSSFLEEAFGGLFRRHNASRQVRDLVRLHAQTASLQPYVVLIHRFMDEAAERVPG